VIVRKSMHRLRNKFIVAEWQVEQMKHKKTLLVLELVRMRRTKKSF